MKYILFLLAGYCNADVIVACTLILEAGGENAKGAMEAVYEVISERAARRNLSLREACLQPNQFSCWRSKRYDILIAHAKKHPKYNKALNIVRSSPNNNITKGADHFTRSDSKPYWVKYMTLTTIIGNHAFYKSQ